MLNRCQEQRKSLPHPLRRAAEVMFGTDEATCSGGLKMKIAVRNGNTGSVGKRARRIVQVLAIAMLFTIVSLVEPKAQVNQDGTWLVAAHDSYPIYDNKVEDVQVMATVCVATAGAGPGGINVSLLSGVVLVSNLFITGPGACHTTIVKVPAGDSVAVSAPVGAQSGTYSISSPLKR
jgi:hypothetical protein